MPWLLRSSAALALEASIDQLQRRTIPRSDLAVFLGPTNPAAIIRPTVSSRTYRRGHSGSDSLHSVSTRQHAGPGPTHPDVPEPSLAERAHAVARLGRIGSLSTHSRKFLGFPFGSVISYAVDGAGRPVFFISSMAMHTRNLSQDPRASLLITQPDVSGDPLGAARATVLGSVREAPGRKFVICTYPALKTRDTGRSISMAESAPGIIQHMNADHADALPLIAHRFAGESFDEAAMMAVDRQGFHLRLKSGDIEMVRQARSSI
jgi:hypothetical protein